MEEKFLVTKEGQISYFEGGRGPRLLFLHGVLATAQAYLPLLELLSNDYRVIAPIHPGHGKSFPISSSWRLDNFVNFYDDCCREQFGPAEVIVGHSFGGTLTLSLAALGLGRHIVVFDAPCLPFALTPAQYFQAMVEETKEIIEQRPDLEVLIQTTKAAGTLIQTAVRHPQDIPLLFREGPKLDITGELIKIKNPVEIFWGAQDKLIPPQVGEKMNRLIVHAHLRVLANRGHNYPVTDPEFTYHELMKALKS